MSRKRTTKQEGTKRAPASRFPRAAVLALAAVAILAAGWWVRARLGAPPAAVTTPAPTAAIAPVPAARTAPVPATDFRTLTGRWQRMDGGYVLEIKSVDATGAMDAGYYNPRSIHVATASASLSGGAIQVFVELRDVNYPGSTYRLTYDPRGDRLAGTYFQAGLGQTYEVTFERATP